MKITILQKLIIFSCLVLAVIGVIGYAVFNSNQKHQEAEKWVQHTQQIIFQTENILSLGKDIESSSRGFVITNDNSFLEPLYTAEKAIFTHIEQLSQLTKDNPEQLSRVDSLNFYIKKRLEFSRRTVELRNNQGLEIAIAYASTKAGKHYSDRMRQITATIQRNENNLLQQRKLTNESSLNSVNRFSIILFFLMIAFAILLLIVTDRNLFQNKEKENRAAELIIANKELVFQNVEKGKRAAELLVANVELAFQNHEKENRAAELIIANKELVFQNEEKGKRAAELLVANEELAFQNHEKEKRAEELIIAKNNAVESDKLKSAFLANMSHEIRTPLNAIVGFSSLLLNPKLSTDDLKDFVRIINSSSNQLLSIISDIMDISKIETGQFYIDIEPVNINELMTEVYEIYEKLVDTKKINLTYLLHSPNKLIQAKTDGMRLRQVICNLLNNAIKFTKEGEIQFGYTIQKNFIEFFVKDRGIGIAVENLNLIFQRFRQVEATNSQINSGNGLGLSISKALVEKFGGTISVHSEPGKGSTFVFTIPYENTEISALPLKSDLIKKNIHNVPEVITNLSLVDELTSKITSNTIQANGRKRVIEKVKESLRSLIGNSG